MDTYHPIWVENKSLATSASIADAGNIQGSVNLRNVEGTAEPADEVMVQALGTFGGAPTGDAILQIFNSIDKGITFDTQPFQTVTLTKVNATAVTASIKVFETPHFRARLLNSSGQALTTASIKFAYRAWRKRNDTIGKLPGANAEV